MDARAQDRRTAYPSAYQAVIAGRARGKVVIVRYADDFVMGFERNADVLEMLSALRERLATFGLSLHEDKTLLIEFGRLAALDRRSRGERRLGVCRIGRTGI